MDKARTRNGITAVLLFTVVGGMVGLAFASVPLYRLFCQVTGFGGTPKTVDVAAPAATAATDTVFTVMLDANVNPSLNWRFRPEVRKIKVRLGEETLALYKARNLADHAVTGTATFNVTPFKAAAYVSKIDCFCFTEQRLEAGQEVSMAVSFYIDPAILDDPDTRELVDIVLSYTFYPARRAADAVADAGKL